MTTRGRFGKLFSDTVILAIGTFGSKLLVFLLMPLYTALLSPSQYGTAELITGTANLIMPFACVGITSGIFRFAAEKGTDREGVFSSGMVLLGAGLCGTVLLGAVALCIGAAWRTEILLVVLYVLAADLQAVCAQYVRAVDRTRLFAVQGILNTLVTVGFNILFLMAFDLGVTGYVLSTVVGNLLTTAFLVVSARLWRVFRLSHVSRTAMRELFRFSLPMVPTTICWLITDLSDRYLVSWFCGEAVNGVYSAAYKIPTIVNLVSGIFMQAWQFSAVVQSADGEECSRFYSQVFRGFLSVIFIGSGGLILLSPWLCRLLLNSAYHEAWRYMPTLLCSAALESVVSFLASVYMVRKKSMHSFLTAVAGTGLNLLLNFLFIPRTGTFGGALGAAIATLIGYAAVWVLRMADVPRLLRFRLYLPRQLCSLALLLAAAAVMTAGAGWSVYATLGLFLVLAGINFPALAAGARALLGHRRETAK
mgnify:FL=1